ncbi:MAG: FkbM family methyltransferase [Lentisphaeria bacterium]|nr:FkbM family methyltransferase [Lentisphaeria bacterium]
MKKWIRDNIIYRLLRYLPDKLQTKLKLVGTCILGNGWDYFYLTSLAGNFSDIQQEDVRKVYADMPEESLNVLLEYLRYCQLSNYFNAENNNTLIVPQYPLFKGLKEKLNSEKSFCASVHLPVDMTITSEVFFYHHGLKELPQQVHEYIADSDFLDLGAWVGDSACILSEYRPHKILSFEPSPEACQIYTANMKKSGIANTVLIPAGVSDKQGVLYFENNTTVFNLDKNRNGCADIVRIDDYLEQHEHARIGLIKADLEGEALKMLQGAVAVIKKDRPVLLLAIYHNADEFLGIYPFLKKEVPNYCYKVRALSGLSEVTLIGYPAELTDKTASEL